MKKKYIFISNMAAPYQVKFCDALQEYFDAEFWFYEHIDDTRPNWWKIPLGDKCKVMKKSGKINRLGYYSFGLFFDLIRFKPDIIVLGGFMKWHIIVLKIAKLINAKVAIMSEPLRYVNGDNDTSSKLRNKENSKYQLKLLKKLFKGTDLYLGMGNIATNQLIEELDLPKEKVAECRYPQDIEEYYNHPLRVKKEGDEFNLLFANRLIDRYQPLFALEVFEQLSKKYNNLYLYMNNDGPLKPQCEKFIEDKNLKNVKFLKSIESWNDMHLIYKKSDVLILPASYSNGNMTITESRASGMGMVLSNRINDVEKNNQNGENCFICDLNINEFIESIEKYINNNNLLINHGKLSRKIVEDKKNEYTAKLYYDLFKEYNLI